MLAVCQKFRHFTSTLAICCYSVFCCPQAKADYIPPGEVNIQTARYQVAGIRFPEARYEFKVAWQGIPVATATIDVEQNQRVDGQYYDVKALAQTGNVIALLYRLQHTSQSLFHAESFQPVHFRSHQLERSKENIRDVSFASDGTIAVEARKGKKTEVFEFQSDNQTLDPISAAFVARSLPIELGTTASFDVFNGKHRYLISFQVAAREVIKVAGREYDAFKVIPTIKRLTETDEDKRLQSAAIWISAEPSREVLKVESKVFVGSVTITLERIIDKHSAPQGFVRTALVR